MIKVNYGYHFTKCNDVFKEYIHTLYDIKSTSDKIRNSLAKSLLNNLLGRFGIRLNNPITKRVDKETFDRLMAVHRIHNYSDINSNDTLVNYHYVASNTAGLIK